MNRKYPKISIVTPSYNQGQYIEETILSVLNQDYPNLEYIIIDGGSTDNTVDIIKKYESHLTYWVSEKDRGQSHAINKGLEKCTGDVFNWLNSDDYLTDGTLLKVAKYFENPSINVVCGKSRLFEEGTNKERWSNGTDIYKNNLAKTIGLARIDQPETFFRKSVVNQMGNVDETFHYVMDKEWWMRYLFLFGLENILKVEDIFVNFRLHQDSKTVSLQEKFTEETKALFNDLIQRLPKTSYPLFKTKEQRKLNIDSLDASLLQSVINYYFAYNADLAYYQGRRKESKKYFSYVDFSLLLEEDFTFYKKVKYKNLMGVGLLRNV